MQPVELDHICGRVRCAVLVVVVVVMVVEVEVEGVDAGT